MFIISVTQPGIQNKDLYKREGKCCRYCLGDRIYYCKFIDTIAIWHQDNLKNRMKAHFSSYHPGAIHPFLLIILVQNNQQGKELNSFCPPNSSDNLCLFFCLNPSSTVYTLLTVYCTVCFRGLLYWAVQCRLTTYCISKREQFLRNVLSENKYYAPNSAANGKA